MPTDTTTIFDLAYTDIHGAEIRLDDLAGRPLLLVNTASKCGFTPQYEGLQALHEQYRDQGLVVIGFPCDQFAHQEPGADADIEAFCQANYGVEFPLASKVQVNGRDTHPVFAFLKSRAGGLLGSSVKWNFTKFLVSPDGQTVRRFSPTTEPADLCTAIEAVLPETPETPATAAD